MSPAVQTPHTPDWRQVGHQRVDRIRRAARSLSLAAIAVGIAVAVVLAVTYPGTPPGVLRSLALVLRCVAPLACLVSGILVYLVVPHRAVNGQIDRRGGRILTSGLTVMVAMGWFFGVFGALLATADPYRPLVLATLLAVLVATALPITSATWFRVPRGPH